MPQAPWNPQEERLRRRFVDEGMNSIPKHEIQLASFSQGVVHGTKIFRLTFKHAALSETHLRQIILSRSNKTNDDVLRKKFRTRLTRFWW
jgi:uncharacterized protein YjbI with pentapeptide repeats